MSARRRTVICDGCERIGGSYGPWGNAGQLRRLRASLAREHGWVRLDLRATGHGQRDLCPPCGAEVMR